MPLELYLLKGGPADPVSESECQWPAEDVLFLVVPFHGFSGCQRRPWCFWLNLRFFAILEGSVGVSYDS